MGRNILFEIYGGLPQPRAVLLKRLHRVIEEELTPCQRETLLAYYFQDMTLGAIASARGVSVSTVCRTLHRAENRLKRYLSY